MPSPRIQGIAGALLLAIAVVPRTNAERLHLLSPLYLQILIADTETQHIREILPDPYPRIIKVYNLYVENNNSLILTTANAVQAPGINRMTINPRAFRGISGYVQGAELTLLGSGPLTALRPGTLLSRTGNLYQLTATIGLLEVEIASGNRRLISSSNTNSPAGSGTPMLAPADMIFTHDGRLLVLDLFEGLLEVDLANGTRTTLHPGGQLPVAARRMDLLPDGRLVFVANATDVPCVWVMEPTTGRINLLTGSFGGIETGTGPAFELAADLTVSPTGRLYVYDSLRPAIFEVGLNGERTIVVAEQPDQDLGLFRADDRPVFANAPPPPPLIKDPQGWLLW